MPVTIKTVHMKYKNSDGEYVGVNSVSDNETSDQIAAIQAAAQTATATQTAAIQAKGTEVLGSIPDTYEDLADQVESVSSALNVLEDTENDYTVEGSFAYLMYETLGLYIDENGDISQREDA